MSRAAIRQPTRQRGVCSENRPRALALVLSLSCLIFAVGFKVPPKEDLRQRLHQEIEEIREMTPTARERALWQGDRQSADEALKAADLAGAPRYAPDAVSEARDLFALAEAYAGDHAYRKAAYLARKAEEAAQRARGDATKARQKRHDAAQSKLDQLRRAVEGLTAQAPSDGEAVRKAAALSLAWSDLRNALELEQFDEVEQGMAGLAKEIRALSQERHEPHGH